MKILAVSDVPCQSLETMIAQSPEKFRDISLIISCGDLESDYLEYLVDGMNRDLLFVTGNHHCEQPFESTPRLPDRFSNPSRQGIRRIAGRDDLHGRVETFRNYLVAGFGGSMWYNGHSNQYTEKAMAKIVRRVLRRIRWLHLQDRLLGRPRREVIVVSHAPVAQVHDQADVCHTGFKCFREFIEKASPLLWLHGHIHLDDIHQNQASVVGQSTVINAYGCKVIEINRKIIQVFSHCSIDKGEAI